jgi:type III secretion system YscJ/HrcJ family lipoprotein
MRPTFKKILLGLTFLALMACDQITSGRITIVHDLQERDANQILVVLNKSGIRAEKVKEEKNQEVSWSVTVLGEQEQQARDILVDNNLPKIRQMGLEGICKDAGLILTPKTEKCREILAYKGEIINSLESIPGVVSADVVLNLPDKDDFPDQDAPPPRPTAAVTILYLPSDNSAKLTEGKVQEFVSNSVSELDPRDVAVVISVLKAAAVPGTTVASQTPTGTDSVKNTGDDELTSVLGLKMDEESAKKFKVLAGLFLVLFLVLASGLIFMLLRISRMKQAPAAANDSDSDQKLLEA